MRKEYKTYILQALLFAVTFATTTLAGAEWMGYADFTWEHISQGLLFSIPFLTILTVHEFGHYITSRIYKLRVTLPYYIPMYFPMVFSIGTLGAFIRIKSPLINKKMVMDVGISGPLAGFVIALGVLFYGFTHLPPREYIFKIHPAYEEYYQKYGWDYEKHIYTYAFNRMQDSLTTEALKKADGGFVRFLEQIGSLPPGWRNRPFEAKPEYEEYSLGKNLLTLLFEKYVVPDPSLIPNKYEMFHYPFIWAGFLALFFTALNLLPMGQLDGGHVIYGLFGYKRHRIISITGLILLIYFSGVGLFSRNFIGNVHGSLNNLMLFGPIYMYLLYFIFSRVSHNWKNNLLIASSIFAAQFFTELLFPDFNGISGAYMFFGILVGRFLGVNHPQTFTEEPLSPFRKALGWISLIIFILCFTPHLLRIEIFRMY